MPGRLLIASLDTQSAAGLEDSANNDNDTLSTNGQFGSVGEAPSQDMEPVDDNEDNRPPMNPDLATGDNGQLQVDPGFEAQPATPPEEMSSPREGDGRMLPDDNDAEGSRNVPRSNPGWQSRRELEQQR